jgi:hypothetical protein
MAASTDTSVLDVIAAEAEGESPLWGAALRDEHDRDAVAVFSPLGEPAHALAIETIYEGYLVHYGVPRLFSPGDADAALLLGDYLYAHGLVRLAASGGVEAVADLAELISLCAQLRADARPGDAEAWAATAACLGQGRIASARVALRDYADASLLRRLAEEHAGADAVATATAAHALRFSRALR